MNTNGGRRGRRSVPRRRPAAGDGIQFSRERRRLSSAMVELLHVETPAWTMRSRLRVVLALHPPRGASFGMICHETPKRSTTPAAVFLPAWRRPSRSFFVRVVDLLLIVTLESSAERPWLNAKNCRPFALTPTIVVGPSARKATVRTCPPLGRAHPPCRSRS